MHHILHLFLVSSAVSHYRLFYLQRCIFSNMHPGLSTGQQHYSAALGYGDYGFGVLVVIELFYRYRIGLNFLNQL